jgi:hypothetical protein
MRNLLCSVVLALAALPFAATAQDDIPPVPIPQFVPADQVDYLGVWSYSSFDHMGGAPCPPARPMAGELTIGGTPKALTLILLSGAVCDPEVMCVLTGALTEGTVLVSTTAALDEGASATTALRLVFLSPGEGRASVSSRYVHSEGVECHWTHQLTLTRPDG